MRVPSQSLPPETGGRHLFQACEPFSAFLTPGCMLVSSRLDYFVKNTFRRKIQTPLFVADEIR
jgi:hypothetical protein